PTCDSSSSERPGRDTQHGRAVSTTILRVPFGYDLGVGALLTGRIARGSLPWRRSPRRTVECARAASRNRVGSRLCRRPRPRPQSSLCKAPVPVAPGLFFCLTVPNTLREVRCGDDFLSLRSPSIIANFPRASDDGGASQQTGGDDAFDENNRGSFTVRRGS